MDNCTTNKIEPFADLLAQKRIVVRFLVPHTSHLTQPLDLGIFGTCKNIMRSRAQYVISLHDLEDAVIEEINEENNGLPPSPERGKQMADFILQILAAFHMASHREGVVTASEQAGICLRATGPDPYMVRRELVHHPLAAFTQLGQVNGARRGIAGGAHMQGHRSDGQNALMADGDFHADHVAPVDLLAAEAAGHLNGFFGEMHAEQGKDPGQGDDDGDEQIGAVAHGQGAKEEEGKADAKGQVGVLQGVGSSFL